MSTIATTKMSSKGQVVIPEEVRNSLHLKTGVRFIVIGKGDAVILKTINPPSLDQFEGMLLEARKQARAVGMKESDIVTEIKRVRGKR